MAALLLGGSAMAMAHAGTGGKALAVKAALSSAYDETSVAGLFPITNQGRRVWNFNPNWRFHLGDAQGAERMDFDDSHWETVVTPHCVKLEPAEASGCRNYQGVAWYLSLIHI